MNDQQGSLFSSPNAYGGIDAKPAARASDPATSHEAAARMARSGAAKAHATIALALVRRRPGCTFHELFVEVATDDERAALGSEVELMRRLGDLRRDGKVRNGDARACRVRGTGMMVWIPT